VRRRCTVAPLRTGAADGPQRRGGHGRGGGGARGPSPRRRRRCAPARSRRWGRSAAGTSVARGCRLGCAAAATAAAAAAAATAAHRPAAAARRRHPSAAVAAARPPRPRRPPNPPPLHPHAAVVDGRRVGGRAGGRRRRRRRCLCLPADDLGGGGSGWLPCPPSARRSPPDGKRWGRAPRQLPPHATDSRPRHTQPVDKKPRATASSARVLFVFGMNQLGSVARAAA